MEKTAQSVNMCGEEVEILENFTCFGSAVRNDGKSSQEVGWRIGLAHGVMDSLSMTIWCCRYLCRQTRIRIFKSLVSPRIKESVATAITTVEFHS